MTHYFLMAILLLLALAAFKIDGYFSMILLLAAMLASSPVVVLPVKYLKTAIVIALVLMALLLFPDIERYREAFEESLQTQPAPAAPTDKTSHE